MTYLAGLLLLLAPVSAHSSERLSALRPGEPPLRAPMAIAAQEGLLPLDQPFVIDSAISPRELAEITTNLPNWLGQPIPAESLERFQRLAARELAKDSSLAVIPRQDHLILVADPERGRGRGILLPTGWTGGRASPAALGAADLQALSAMFDQRRLGAPAPQFASREAPAAESPGRSLVIVDMQEGAARGGYHGLHLGRDWWRRHEETVSNIRTLAGRFDRVYFMVHTGFRKPRFIEIVDGLKDVAAGKGRLVYKIQDGGAPALEPFLRKAEELFVVGMNTDACILRTAMGLLKLGFDVNVVADAVWTAYAGHPANRYFGESHRAALRALGRKGVSLMRTKDVP